MRAIPILALSLALASAAQAGPALFQASFILHSFGSAITDSSPPPTFLALPLGNFCGYPPCTSYVLTQGAPATGSGTIGLGMGMPPSIMLPQSAFGITTVGSLPATFPYTLRATYANIANGSGSFFAGGGPAAGRGTVTYTGTATPGAWVIREGPNAFGGVLGILGNLGGTRIYTIPYYPGLWYGSSSWNFVKALGRSTGDTMNPYANAGTLFNTALTLTFPIWKYGAGTPWTTGSVAVYLNYPVYPYSKSLREMGYDTTTVGGVRNIQLVTPAVTQWQSVTGTRKTGHIGILRLQIIPPDEDDDTIPDPADNCRTVPNAGGQFCDTDSDGYGNACDADLNNDGVVDDQDLDTFDALFSTTGASDGDLNCDLVVGGPDYAIFGLNWNGAPGPSGLACAGTVPCP